MKGYAGGWALLLTFPKCGYRQIGDNSRDEQNGACNGQPLIGCEPPQPKQTGYDYETVSFNSSRERTAPPLRVIEEPSRSIAVN